VTKMSPPAFFQSIILVMATLNNVTVCKISLLAARLEIGCLFILDTLFETNFDFQVLDDLLSYVVLFTVTHELV